MDIRQLQCFAEVATLGSYTKAAGALFLTRQALSRTVKQLEAELGFALFDLDDGRISLTDQGRRFDSEIGPVLDEFNALRARWGAQTKRPVLNLAMARGFFDVVENDFISGFFERDAEFHVTVEESHADGVLDMVRSGSAEVGLLGTHPQFLHDFDYLALAHPGYNLLVPVQNELAGRTYLELEDLDGQPLVMLGKKNHLHRLFTAECERAGVHPDILIETSEDVLRDKYVSEAAALAFACSPKSSRPNVPTVCLPLCMRDAQIFGTYAIRRRGTPLTVAASRFWSCLEEQAI